MNRESSRPDRPLRSGFGFRTWSWGGTFGRWTLWADRLEFRALDILWFMQRRRVITLAEITALESFPAGRMMPRLKIQTTDGSEEIASLLDAQSWRDAIERAVNSAPEL